MGRLVMDARGHGPGPLVSEGIAPADDFAPLPERPRTRGDCQGAERPCPWASCVHHAIHARLIGEGGQDLTDDQAVELLETLPDTCTLDVADRGGVTLEDAGNVFGVTRERIRQIEGRALKKVLFRAPRLKLQAPDEDPPDALEAARARHEGSGHCPAPPLLDRREWAPAPAYATELADHTEVPAGGRFWCGRMLAVVTTTLCLARQTALRSDGRPGRPSNKPLHPHCADCPEGAALRLRLSSNTEPNEEPMPAQPARPEAPPTITLVQPPPPPESVTRVLELRPGVTQEVVTITPELAAKMLSRRAVNRHISGHTVTQYVADLRAGAWRTTHQGIAFDAEGTLIDGEHRLRAILEAGVSVVMVVTRGLTEADRETFDQGRARSVSDALKISGGEGALSTRAVSWVRCIVLLEAGTNLKLSPAATKSHARPYLDSITWALGTFAQRGPLHRAPVVAGMVYAHAVLPEVVQAFTRAFLTGVGLTEGSPVLAFRSYVLERVAVIREAERPITLKTLRALQLFHEGAKIQLLRESDEGLTFFRALHAGKAASQ